MSKKTKNIQAHTPAVDSKLSLEKKCNFSAAQLEFERKEKTKNNSVNETLVKKEPKKRKNDINRIDWENEITNYVIDIKHAAYVLNVCLNIFTTNEFPEIPIQVLKQIIKNEKHDVLKILNKSVEEQEKFTKAVFDQLVEEGRKSIVRDGMNEWCKQPQCFLQVMKCFNQNNLNILTPINETNALDGSLLIKELRINQEIVDCMTVKDYEILRKNFLMLYQSKKDNGCSCCIKRYISTDLKKHKDPSFKSRFPEIFKKCPLYVPNPPDLNTGLFIPNIHNLDSYETKENLIDLLLDIGIDSETFRNREEFFKKAILDTL